MTKVLIGGVVAVAVLVGGFFWLNSYIYQTKQGPTDYKDATFMLDGAPVTINDSSIKYFGNQAKGDLNGDTIPDLAFLITYDGGGSGTFYYVVAAIQTPANTYNGSDAVLLGDRIAPQSTEIRDGKVVVNYADRAPGEPMTTAPSVGKTLVLLLDPESLQFGEVAQNFEGEADPSRMTLGMKKWTWVSALYNDGREVKPKATDAFTLSFGSDGRFSATTDCNSMSGSYTTGANGLEFSQIVSTKMYCEGSQEAEFATMLQTAQGHHFTSRGELIVDLKFDSGSVVFK
jgi:heat shock protein HslJ